MLDPLLLTPDQRVMLLREAVYYSHMYACLSSTAGSHLLTHRGSTRYSHVGAPPTNNTVHKSDNMLSVPRAYTPFNVLFVLRM